MSKLTLAFPPIFLILSGCGPKPPSGQSAVAAFTSDFVYSTLALSPALATSSGYHEHRGTTLDTQLDDWSQAGIDASLAHFRGVAKRLDEFKDAPLDPESRADLRLIDAQARLALLEFEKIQSYRHNPTIYVETLGNALFAPYSVEYAPKETRYRHIIARLLATPRFLEQAKTNLAGSNEVWARVAAEENDGTIALIEKPLRDGAPPSMRAEFDQAAASAVAALRAFNAHLKSLPAEGPEAWRLGKELYAQKFPLALGVSQTPDEVLADAETQMETIRRKMFDLALPLHHKYFPTHRDRVDLNLIVGETLGRIAQNHVPAADYFEEARRTLEETRAFMKSKDFLTLPGQDNLQLIETPAFMRGVYGVGGFNAAPPIQPQLGAFYWLTPIPPGWPKERVESKLREYNRYGLRILTIHEAIPGHYVQLEYANRVQPEPRRVLRSLFGSNTYVEGWAVYATDLMLEQGYLANEPEMQLTWYKQLLRALSNSILDIKMQTMNMKDEEAIRLMLERTFQEKEEATAKLQRAKLSSCQLPTYWVGYNQWKALRAKNKLPLKQFHEQALASGATFF